MFCSKCGAQIEAGSRFCIKCGNPVVTRLTTTEEVAPAAGTAPYPPQAASYVPAVGTAPYPPQAASYVPAVGTAPYPPATRKKKPVALIVGLSIAVLLVIGGASALLIIDPLGWFDKKPAVVEEPTRDGSSLGFDARVGDTSRNREAAVVVAATNNGTLEIIDITVGSGAQVTRGDTITVDYVGYLVDGTVFDTSIGREPFEVEIGIGYLIEGFDEGLLGMKEGGRRVLVIPAGMAYGSEESSYIPANSLLVFDVELLAVK